MAIEIKEYVGAGNIRSIDESGAKQDINISSAKKKTKGKATAKNVKKKKPAVKKQPAKK